MSTQFPRLLADIGGQFARFTLETTRGRFAQPASLKCREHADFQSAVEAYLRGVTGPKPVHAAVATANPVDGDWVKMTNYHWQFSIAQTRERLGLETLVVVNDATALAMAVPWLAQTHLVQVGGEAPRDNAAKGVMGAGTGLGVSGLIPTADGWVALGTEGGHASFSPHDESELVVLRHAWKSFDHVSFERLISAGGLELIYEALALEAGSFVAPLRAQDITRRAEEKDDALCQKAIDVFCGMLGTAASNLAVTLGAKGGIYIGGSIVPSWGERFIRSSFRARFENKGRFKSYLRDVPVFIIHDSDATFSGAAAILDAQLKIIEGSSSAFLLRIQRHLADLSPAEKRVAEYVLAHPQRVTNDPIADIASAADVSQPTVIRFCRSLGCDGLSDFKLKLASGLSATLPMSHAQVTVADSIGELSAKVLGNTAAAVLQERDRINREALDAAMDALSSAQHVAFFAAGHSSIVAHDAQFKFLRFGVPCSAYAEPRLQELAAHTLGERDVAVIISSAGRMPHLLQAAQTARSRGAQVIAITASQSPLAKAADVALLVDHDEDPDTEMPMISRILHLLIIDVLAVGIAVRRSNRSDAQAAVNAASAKLRALGPDAASSKTTGPLGVVVHHSLSSLTKHAR
jgi:glucokinase